MKVDEVVEGTAIKAGQYVFDMRPASQPAVGSIDGGRHHHQKERQSKRTIAAANDQHGDARSADQSKCCVQMDKPGKDLLRESSRVHWPEGYGVPAVHPIGRWLATRSAMPPDR